MKTPNYRHEIVALERERTQLFSDGVFAIVITLLILDVRVPSGEVVEHVGLFKALVDLWPNAASYIISFLSVGIFWIGHHNMMHYFTRVDRNFMWLNLIYLMAVAFLPFTTGLVSEYTHETLAASLYAINLAIAGGYLFLAWTYATWNNRLVEPTLSKGFIRTVKQRVLLAPAVFLFAALIAGWRPLVAIGLIFLVQLIYILPHPYSNKFWAEE